MKKTTMALWVAAALSVAAGVELWLWPHTLDNLPPAAPAAPAAPATPADPAAPAAPATPAL